MVVIIFSSHLLFPAPSQARGQQDFVSRVCAAVVKLADTRDLKSLSGDRVRVRPPSAACKSPESFVGSNDSGLFLFRFLATLEGREGFFAKKGSLDFYAAKGRSFFRFLRDTEQPITAITEETVEDSIFYTIKSALGIRRNRLKWMG